MCFANVLVLPDLEDLFCTPFPMSTLLHTGKLLCVANGMDEILGQVKIIESITNIYWPS